MDNKNHRCDGDGICKTAGDNDAGDVAYGVFCRNVPAVAHNNVFGRGRCDAVSDRSDNGYFLKVLLYRHAYFQDD